MFTRRSFAALASGLAAVAVYVAGCGSNDNSVFGTPNGANGASAADASAGPSQSLVGDATTCDPNVPQAGCSCPTPGAIQECGKASCRDGVRKCIRVSSEFNVWGPCHSASTGQNCEDNTASGGNNGSTGSSGGGTSGGGPTTGQNGEGSSGNTGSGAGGSGGGAGTGQGTSGGTSGGTTGIGQGASGGTGGTGTGTSGGTSGTGTGTSGGGGTGPCVCKAGTQRWCDTPIACNWGTQTCTPSGQWGPCSETSSRPANCLNPNDPSYDQDCCVAAGQCCQNILHLIDPSQPENVGNCTAQLCQ